MYITESDLNIIKAVDAGFKPCHIVRFMGRTMRQITKACDYAGINLKVVRGELSDAELISKRESGRRFVDIANEYNIPVNEVILQYGQIKPVASFKAFPGSI